MQHSSFDRGRRDAPPNFQLAELPMPADTDDSVDLSKYVNAIRRRWPLLVVCVLLAAAYAFVRYTLTTKEYSSTTTIQIERKRLSLYALGQGGWLEDWWNLEYYPTQYRLLRSRGMAERVVKNLRLYEHPVFTGRKPATGGGEDSIDASSSIELAQLAAVVQGGLTVRPIKETQLVELSFRSPSPELAAQIADGYAEAFIEWGIETRHVTVGQASTLLSDQIDTLSQEIEARRKKLNELSNQDGELALDPEGKALLERQGTLEAQYNSVVAERIGKDAAYKGILALAPETVANTNTGGQVSKLKSQLFLLESEYETKLEDFLPTWPEMVRRREEISDLKGQLNRLITDSYNETKNQAFAEYQKALREEQSLEEELRRLAEDARLQNSTALEYSTHRTYIETRQQVMDDLTKRLSETEIASRTQGSQESNVRIVDRAIVPAKPFRPSLKNNLSQALFMGLALGFAGIFLLEFLDRTIKTPEELEGIIGFPTLAIVPDMEDRGRGRGLRRYGTGG
ncbi:MAG: GumC family protein [Acidobacteriota bacterium]